MLSIVLAIFATVAAPQVIPLPVPQEVQTYRVVSRDVTTGPSGTAVGYTLSVDRFLSPGQMAVLLCGMVKKEKPPAAAKLTIQVFYMLDSVNPGSEGFSPAQLRERMLAEYLWDVTGAPHHLTVSRDPNGVLLDRAIGYEFNHTHACSGVQ